MFAVYSAVDEITHLLPSVIELKTTFMQLPFHSTQKSLDFSLRNTFIFICFNNHWGDVSSSLACKGDRKLTIALNLKVESSAQVHC